MATCSRFDVDASRCHVLAQTHKSAVEWVLFHVPVAPEPDLPVEILGDLVEKKIEDGG